ncbi:hypothetical protein SDC9_03513 [bioreactor metagenome]|uniref:PepSY domain-containing protein n=1 Tax=bioreactor metagenome TaxID=1076179 RepID=A0A644STH8_9ZZZZ|nr:hypothetical protein [Methanobrevibacter sp.]MEA4956132.1 hypothetical protein [Methanobrevibacter sp.]
MKNKSIIILLIILIAFLGGVFYLSPNIVSETAVGSSESNNSQDNPISYKAQFEEGDKIIKLQNFSNMSSEEKDDYVKKLAESKGYDMVTNFEPEDGFQIWHAINSSSNPEKHMNIIIQKNTGEVVIYKED